MSCQTVKSNRKKEKYFEFHGLNVMAANEQGLALLGYLKNVSPQLKPNIVLKVEVKN